MNMPSQSPNAIRSVVMQCARCSYCHTARKTQFCSLCGGRCVPTIQSQLQPARYPIARQGKPDYVTLTPTDKNQYTLYLDNHYCGIAMRDGADWMLSFSGKQYGPFENIETLVDTSIRLEVDLLMAKYGMHN